MSLQEESLALSIEPTLWYKFNTSDITGSTVKNYGTLSTIGDGALRQTASASATTKKFGTASLDVNSGAGINYLSTATTCRHMKLPNITLTTAKTYSMSLWFYITSVSNTANFIVVFLVASPFRRFYINATVGREIKIGANSEITLPSFNLNTWNFIGYSVNNGSVIYNYNGTTGSGFIGGSSEKTFTTDVNTLGANITENSKYFNGFIDSFRFFDGALSADDLLKLYYEGQVFLGSKPTLIASPILNSPGVVSLQYNQTTTGTTPVTYYYSQINNGNTSSRTQFTSNPINVSGVSGTTTYYAIANNPAGNIISEGVGVTPYLLGSVPVIQTVTPGYYSLTIHFNQTVTGNPTSTYSYSFDPMGTNSVAVVSNPFTIENVPLQPTTVYIIATNLAGNIISEGSSGTPFTTPDKPIIRSIEGGNEIINVSLDTSVFNGGNTYTTYYYSTNNGETYTSTGGNITNPYTISSGITNGTTYTVSFITRNFAGNSVASDAVSVTPLSFPGAPVINAIIPGNRTFDVSFGAPLTDGGTAITDYAYSFFPNSAYTSVGPTPTVFPVPDLSNGTPYTIYMIATNAVGNTVVPSNRTATPRTFPGAPIINTATPGNASISITFSAPEDDGGNAITGYSYSYFPDSSYNPIGPSPTTFPIPGLNNGTSYTIYLKATNSVGSTLVASSTTLTPRTVPNAPSIVSLISRDSTLQATITAPANNGGSSITGYYYTVNGSAPVFGASGLYNSFFIPNLINGNTYTIAVLAENVAGLSVASSSVTRILYTVPGSPLVSTIEYTQTTISMTVSEPESNGGNAITGYYYVIGNSGYQFLGNVAGVSYTISELVNSRNTAVNIYAQNAAGYSAPFIIPSQNILERSEVVPNIIRLRSSFSNNLSYYKTGSLTTSGSGSGVSNSRAIKRRT